MESQSRESEEVNPLILCIDSDFSLTPKLYVCGTDLNQHRKDSAT